MQTRGVESRGKLTLGHADLAAHHVRCPIERAYVLGSIQKCT